MFFCNNPKFVYVSFTKSGSSSMYGLLKTHFNGKTAPRHHKKIPDQYRSYPKFCVVRNPYARLVSWWWAICKVDGDRYGHKRELKQLGQPQTLTGFMRLWETKNGLSQYQGIEVNGEFDYVLKIENIEEEFNALPFITKHIPIPKRNAREHPHWTELMEPEAGRIINRIYQKDFEYFNYEMLEFND